MHAQPRYSRPPACAFPCAHPAAACQTARPCCSLPLRINPFPAGAAAAVCISRPGAMPSLPDRPETLRQMGQHPTGSGRSSGGGGAAGAEEGADGSGGGGERHGGGGLGLGGLSLGGGEYGGSEQAGGHTRRNSFWD